MRNEISRQLVHLGGFVFVLFAQFSGKLTGSLVFFLIAIALFVYAEHVKKDRRYPGFTGRVEVRIRDMVFKLDRNAKRPFIGAFWFYFALGLTFLLFPLNVATAAGLILSVGDALSTIIGLNYGEHKIFGNKSLEGSITFFLSSFLITAAMVGSFAAFMGSISATFVELVPELKRVKKWEKKEIVDDNWLIPLFSGLIMYASIVLLGVW